jgi:beta-lactamase regulating signal transducer with metallopeptidase domain
MIWLNMLDSSACRHLVFALLHTLWQGPLIAMILAILLQRLAARRQAARYWLAIAAQFGLLVAGLTTWSVLDYRSPIPAPSPAMTSTNVPMTAIQESVASTTPHDTISPPVSWIAVVAAGWAVGVGLMMARTAGALVSTRRLANGLAVADPAILGAVDRLRREMGIARSIRVIEFASGHGPAVLGVIWPSLLLPTALMTGLSPDALRAILAHELAHIRRHDYLINLLQMTVESLLFFNPAAWWIGRQARIEREACCDATAVGLTGRPIEYSRSLADWAERSSQPAIAMAWGGDGRPSTLLERVRRVLRPGDRPGAQAISWTGLIVLLLLGPLLVFGLWRGTNVAVGLAAQILSPAERIERIGREQVAFTSPGGEPEAGGKATLTGTIRLPDGTLPAKPVAFTTITKTSGSTSIASANAFKDAFSVEVPTGMTWLSIAPLDHAMMLVGPFHLKKTGEVVDGIKIVLEPGFTARVRVTDEAGKPVAGAVLKGALAVDGGWGSSHPGWITDRDGIATIPHAARKSYGFSLSARGFQEPKPVTMTPTEGGTLAMTIVHAKPTRGAVVDESGKPIAGATIRAISEMTGENSSNWYAGTAPVLATTDDAGRFALESLLDGSTYVLLIETKAGVRGIADGIKAGQDGLRLGVGPGHAIVGRVTGDLATLQRNGATRSVRIDQGVGVGSNRLDTWAAVDASGRFRATGLMPVETVIQAGKQSVRVDLKGPETQVTIDLNAARPDPKRRRVVLKFLTPDAAPLATGSIAVIAATADNEAPASRVEYKIERGEVAFDAPVPGRVMFEPKVVIGYWFKDGDVNIEAADGPKIVEVPTFPGGAISGQVLGPDGAPIASGVSLGYRTVGTLKMPGGESLSFNRANFRVDSEGRFFLSPVPLGGTYVVTVHLGHKSQVSEPLTLDGASPTGRVTLRIPKTGSAEGRVVDPEGRPIAGAPITLEFVHPLAGMGWSPATPTDANGRFRFDDLGADVGRYKVILDSRKRYQPAEATLNLGGPAVEIRTTPGHIIEGRFVDLATGFPIPGIEVYAHPQAWKVGERYGFEAESMTDADGRFRFSNLPAGDFQLNDRNGLKWEVGYNARTVGTDQNVVSEFRVTLPSWSSLRVKAR